MAKRRFIDIREQSFFRNYIFDMVVPKDHYLRILHQIMPWEDLTEELIELYAAGAEYGRPPFNPTQMLKMCLLAIFYDLSGRQVETFVNENLPEKYFLGLGLDYRAPDNSTLSLFQDRCIKNGNLEIFEGILDRIITAAQESEIKFGSIHIIDSVHSEADVNTGKNQSRKDGGKGPRDPDANWGVKGKQKSKDLKGKDVHQVKYFYGYKGHVSMNAENDLITSLEVTSG